MKMNLLLINANIINVLNGEIYKSDIYIENGIIKGFEKKGNCRIIDLNGKYVSPGFIEGHIHLESTHVLPIHIYKEFLKNGVTTVINDPHEIANAGGLKGIEFFMKQAEDLPVDFLFMIPSCVPASKFETTIHKIGIKEMKYLKNKKQVLGLAEMMNYPGVINGDREVLRKLSLFKGEIIDGHCPFLRGQTLDKYISYGIYSDHETVMADEAIEKIKKGMYLMIRSGSSAINIDLVKVINNENDTRFMLVSDDISPVDMIEDRYIKYTLKKALEMNRQLSPVSLIKGLTVNPATYFRLHNRGIIAPGYKADLVILDDLKTFNINMTIKNGRIVYKNGRAVNIKKTHIKTGKMTVKIKHFTASNFIRKTKKKYFPAIVINESSLITDSKNIAIKNNLLKADIENDILLISSIERYSGNSKYSIGLVNGFGLKGGAVASSYNHDAHNILVIGVETDDMAIAVNHLKHIGGGVVYVKSGKIVDIKMPIYGILSSMNLNQTAKAFRKLENALRNNGVHIKHPLTQMSFLSLSVIPKLKITDKGIIDSEKFKIIG